MVANQFLQQSRDFKMEHLDSNGADSRHIVNIKNVSAILLLSDKHLTSTNFPYNCQCRVTFWPMEKRFTL